MTMFLCSTGKMKRGAKWYTEKEVKPKKRYTCGWCGSRSKKPYKWVNGLKSCCECNEKYGN